MLNITGICYVLHKFKICFFVALRWEYIKKIDINMTCHKCLTLRKITLLKDTKHIFPLSLPFSLNIMNWYDSNIPYFTENVYHHYSYVLMFNTQLCGTKYVYSMLYVGVRTCKLKLIKVTMEGRWYFLINNKRIP